MELHFEHVVVEYLYNSDIFPALSDGVIVRGWDGPNREAEMLGWSLLHQQQTVPKLKLEINGHQLFVHRMFEGEPKLG